MVTCNACPDQLWQTTFYEPPHDRGHDLLTSRVTAPDLPALSAPATTARATAAASGPEAAKMVTTQMISPAVCAVRTLACLAVTANTAGSTWRPGSVAIRMVMS